MKKLLTISMALLLVAGVAQAQGFKFTLYGGGGVSMPMAPEEFKDAYKMGMQFGGGAGVQVGSMVEIGARFYLYDHDVDEDGLLQAAWEEAGGSGDIPSTYSLDADGIKTKLTEITGTIKLMLGSAESGVRPYLVGSVGTGKYKIESGTLRLTGPGVNESRNTREIEDDGTCYGGGLGIDFMFSPAIGMFVEGEYMMVNSEGDDPAYIPIRAGLRIAIGFGK